MLPRAATQRLSILLTSLLIAIGIVVPAAAQEPEGRIIWAAPGGAPLNDADGSENNPFGDIEYALYALEAGDTLYLRGGEYRQQVGARKPLNRGTPEQRITITSAPGERATLVGSLDLTIGDSLHYWTLKDFDVRWDDAIDEPNRAMVRIGGGVGWIVEGMEISGARSYANFRVLNQEPGSARDWIIRNNCIHDTIPTRTDRINTEHNLYIGGGSSSRDFQPGGGLIEGNVIFNAANGSNIKLGAGESHLPGTHDVIVRDNVLAGAPQNILIPWKSYDNVVENNLFAQDGSRTSWSQPWYPNVRGLELEGNGNIARGNGGDATGGVVGNNKSSVAVGDVDNVLLEPGKTGISEVSCEGLRDRGAPGNSWGPDAVRLETTRLAGTSRVATSAVLSRTAYPDGADTVLLARSDNYADALAGAPLAGQLGAPLLLTSKDGLSPEARDEIRRLGASTAVLLGSEGALSTAVARDVSALGLKVERLAGDTRFDTAATVAAELSDASRVYLVEGQNSEPSRGWPDAVALSSLAARTGTPVLLTTRDALPADTAAALKRLDPDELVVVGGTTAVSDAVMAAAGAAAGVTPTRIFGQTRYDTSAKLAELAVRDGADASNVWLVTGLNWPDALGAGPAAATAGATLLFVHGNDARNSQATLNWLKFRTDPEELVVTLVGGEGAISSNAERTLAAGAPGR